MKATKAQRVNRTYPEDCVDFLIVGRNPSDESKSAQTGPDVIREPEQHEGKNSHIAEEPISVNSPAVCGSTALRLVQSSEENCR